MFLLSSLLLLLLLFFVSQRVMTAAKKPKNVKPKSGDNDAAEKKIGDLRCKTLTGGRTKPVSSPATNLLMTEFVKSDACVARYS